MRGSTVVTTMAVALLSTGCVSPAPKRPVAEKLSPAFSAPPFPKPTNVSPAAGYAVDAKGSSTTKNDVTVTFAVMGAEGAPADKPRSVVRCATPGGEEGQITVPGQAVAITVKNGTDHIVRFAGSVLKVHDGAGQSLPVLRASWRDWVAGAREDTTAFYSRYRAVIPAWKAASGADLGPLVAPSSQNYQRAYAKYKQDVEAYESDAGNFLETDSKRRVRAEFEATPTPQQVGEDYKGVARRALEDRAKEFLGQIDGLEAAALGQLEALLGSPGPFVATGGWEGLQVLPGHSLTVTLLLERAFVFESSGPKEIAVVIYDLVTKVDAASNPVERSHFEGKLVRK